MKSDISPPGHDCPSGEILQSYELGILPKDTWNHISTHLSRCKICQSRLKSIHLPDRAVTASGGEPEEHHTDASGTVDWTTESFVQLIDEPSLLRQHMQVAGLAKGSDAVIRFAQYGLVDVLGKGGMGEVCLGYHFSLKKWVAIKILPREATIRAAVVARFQREMEAIGQLDHPNIVRATDAGQADGIHYLVMELIDGPDLNRLLRHHSPLSIANSCEAIRQAATGLHYAHERRMVHRDLKPSNLIITRTGVVKILDLGLALLTAHPEDGSHLTGTGQVMGTLNFMAPEQWEKASTVDIRADIYSLGCTLFSLLTGRPPYGGPDLNSAIKKMKAHAEGAIPSARARRDDIPEDLDQILTKMMAKLPSDRFATPEQLAAALLPFCAGANLAELAAKVPPIQLPKPPKADRLLASSTQLPALPLPQPMAETPRKRRGLAWLTGIALFALCGTSLAVALIPRKQAPNAESPRELTAEEQRAKEIELVLNRQFEPNKWYELLDHKPVEYSWDHEQGRSTWDYDEKLKTVRATCFSRGVLSLGKIEATEYEYRITLRQAVWTGGVGLFVGGHEAINPERTAYQSFYLHKLERPADFTIMRSYAYFRPFLPGITEHPLNDAGRGDIGEPQHREHLLAVTVRNGLPSRVTWDGVINDNVLNAVVSQQLTREYTKGHLGLCFYNSSATIRSAQLFIYGSP